MTNKTKERKKIIRWKNSKSLPTAKILLFSETHNFFYFFFAF